MEAHILNKLERIENLLKLQSNTNYRGANEPKPDEALATADSVSGVDCYVKDTPTPFDPSNT